MKKGTNVNTSRERAPPPTSNGLGKGVDWNC